MTRQVLIRTVVLTVALFGGVFLLHRLLLRFLPEAATSPQPTADGPAPLPPPALHPDAAALLDGLSEGDLLGDLRVAELRGPVRGRIEIVLQVDPARRRRLWVTRAGEEHTGAAQSGRYGVIVEGRGSDEVQPALDDLVRRLRRTETRVPTPPGL